jgi:hypothetical protein
MRNPLFCYSHVNRFIATVNGIKVIIKIANAEYKTAIKNDLEMYFRIVFLKNKIASCSEIWEVANDVPFYTHENGQLIFALVKADNEDEARKMGLSIVDKVTQAHSHGQKSQE